jgi:beta-phosphoglucomutase
VSRPKRPGAILWDLDGTIVDTGDLHFIAWQATLTAEGLVYGRADFERDFGRSNPEILAELFPHATRDQHQRLADDKESAFRSAMTGRIQLFAGVKNWMSGFQAAGIPQVVCSSGPTANIASTVVELGIADHFLALVSGVHVPYGKPAPDLFLRGAAVANVAPETCIVIEDSHHGIEAAAAAGMGCVVVGALAQEAPRLQMHFKSADQLRAIQDLSTVPYQSVVEWWDRHTE